MTFFSDQLFFSIDFFFRPKNFDFFRPIFFDHFFFDEKKSSTNFLVTYSLCCLAHWCTTIQDRYKSILKNIFFDVLEFFGTFFVVLDTPLPTSDSWPCLFWLVRLGCVFFFHLDPEFRPLESLNDDISELRRSRIKNWVSRHNYFLRTLT